MPPVPSEGPRLRSRRYALSCAPGRDSPLESHEETAINRHRLGRVLILVGVLAWAPYAVLHYLMDLDVPVWPFLTVHLMGVIPGSILSRWNQISGLFGQGDEKDAPGSTPG